MDAQMPEIDGIGAPRSVKQRLPSVKVLFLIVHTQHIEAAVAAGADACLMKDCSRQELVESLCRLVEPHSE